MINCQQFSLIQIILVQCKWENGEHRLLIHVNNYIVRTQSCNCSGKLLLFCILGLYLQDYFNTCTMYKVVGLPTLATCCTLTPTTPPTNFCPTFHSWPCMLCSAYSICPKFQGSPCLLCAAPTPLPVQSFRVHHACCVQYPAPLPVQCPRFTMLVVCCA